MSRFLLLFAIGCSEYGLKGEKAPEGDGGEDALPDIAVSPDAIDLGTLLEGSGPVDRTITISNQGDAPLTLADVRIQSMVAGYTVTAPTSTTLPASGLATVVLSFAPLAAGPFEADLVIDSDDPDEATVLVPITALVEADSGFDTADPETSDCDCPDGYEPREAGDGCVRETRSDPTWQGAEVDVCAIEPYFAYGKLGVRWPGGTTEQSAYWGQDNGSSGGRLNEVGVWACDGSGTAGSGTAGSAPVGEWIGFSVCVELSDPGLYLMGLGADNRMRLSVDGTRVMENTDDETRNFNYWWVQAVELSSGTHLLEFEGYNAGSIAGFGAELSGPFPLGTGTDDSTLSGLDYAGNLSWSTAEAVGSAFALGEASGWSCPDGAALDICGEEPACVVTEEADCVE